MKILQDTVPKQKMKELCQFHPKVDITKNWKKIEIVYSSVVDKNGVIKKFKYCPKCFARQEIV